MLRLFDFAQVFILLAILSLTIHISLFMPLTLQYKMFRISLQWGYPVLYTCSILLPIMFVYTLLYSFSTFPAAYSFLLGSVVLAFIVFRYRPWRQKYIGYIWHLYFNAYNYHDCINEAELFAWISLTKGFKKYPMFKSLLFEVGHNQFTEIDAILVTESGVYVIEVKDYEGSISGNAYSDRWIRTNLKGNDYLVSNTLRQNQNHINALAHLLHKNGITNIPFYNFVVLGYKGYWIEVTDLYAGCCYCNISNMNKYIKQNIRESSYKMRPEIVGKIAEIIDANKRTDAYARHQHVVNCMAKDEEHEFTA